MLAGPWLRTFFQEGTPTPAEPPITISNPIPGQALQGLVRITGLVQLDGITSAELDFTYQDDPRETWFLIWRSDRLPESPTIAEWDTTTLTDGNYNLRLLFLTESSQVEYEIAGLRVRNYSPIETDTPPPTVPPAPQDTPIPTPTATATETPIPPTSTPLPTNPAQLTSKDVTDSLGRGALVTIGLFAMLGLYQLVRKTIRRGK
jgi:hypothetical protein